MKNRNANHVKSKVAEEAAFLLYTGQEKEFKQAKMRAATTLGVRVLPTNREVADALNMIAEESEGSAKKERLVQMRKEALHIMLALENFSPRLIGSVWRGTANKNSDIDIVACHTDPDHIVSTLKQNCYNAARVETQSTTKKGARKTSVHIYLTLPSNHNVEIVVKNPENKTLEKCEIYQDPIIGLSIDALRRILKTNATQTFTPK